jgi:hypothetical protein
MLQVVKINNKNCGTGNKQLLGWEQAIAVRLIDNYWFSSITNKWIMAVRSSKCIKWKNCVQTTKTKLLKQENILHENSVYGKI